MLGAGGDAFKRLQSAFWGGETSLIRVRNKLVGAGAGGYYVRNSQRAQRKGESANVAVGCFGGRIVFSASKVRKSKFLEKQRGKVIKGRLRGVRDGGPKMWGFSYLTMVFCVP